MWPFVVIALLGVLAIVLLAIGFGRDITALADRLTAWLAIAESDPCLGCTDDKDCRSCMPE